MINYKYHEVDDGIALDDFEITTDMPTIRTAGGIVYLACLELPNEIQGKPVVELSADFHKGEIEKRYRWFTHDFIAHSLIIPKNLKRIRCPLISRGIYEVDVSEENADIIFDEYAWYEDGGSTVVSTWRSGKTEIEEYVIRDGTVRASLYVDQRFELKKLTFPDSFQEINDSFLVKLVAREEGTACRPTVQKIFANYDSCIRKHAEKIGAEFVALDCKQVDFSTDGAVLIKCSPLFAESVYYIPEHVRRIENYAFKENAQIREIIIPNTVEEIGEGAFYACQSLERVVLPSKLSELSKMTFAKCKSLNSIVWPDQLTSIGEKCFAGTGFTDIVIPNTVEEIHDYAFATFEENECQNIKSVEISDSVSKIGISICAGIEEIVVFDSIECVKPSRKSRMDDLEWSYNIACIGMRQRENFVNSVYNAKLFRYTIIVKSKETNKIKYEVLMFGEEEGKKNCSKILKAWDKNAGFDFITLDGMFASLKYFENKLQTAINRLRYPIDLTEEMRGLYIEWFKRNASKVATRFVEKGSILDLKLLEEYHIITKSNIKRLLELSAEKGNAEITAYLLNYKNERLV